ncbi:hypothetical protein C8F01DRAFT_1250059 [Mycena amicta]|nr:hypothetical protein C8F01DRAFT_1250059 [Mycena amicta]
MSAPPVYDADGYTLPSVTPLPAYRPRDSAAGRSRGHTEHAFPLNDKRTKIRAVLKLTSSAPTSESLPVVLEGSSMVGSLVVNIPSSEKITRVLILVRGEILLGGPANEVNRSPHLQSDKFRFLNISVPLWEKSSSTGGGALLGDCQWPFSVSIPKDVMLNDPERPKVQRKYTLPQTFLERGAALSVRYSIMARICYKSFFRDVDAEVQTMFVYVPVLRSDPPSPLRQLAYQDNFPIPGPELDPGGWHNCAPVAIKGTVFNARPVQLQCVLSLAQPAEPLPAFKIQCSLNFQLSYTRGGLIPCFLTIHCRDLQALDLLATPSAISVRLQRKIVCTPFYTGSGHCPLTANDVQECARAVWWPGARNTQRPDTRAFEGEIALPKTLKPTSAISQFTLDYFVIMQPPSVIGFASADIQTLMRQEVQIATVFSRGPKPRSYAPP